MDCFLHTARCNYHLLEITIPAFFFCRLPAWTMRCLWWQMSKRICYKNKKQNTLTWLLPSLPLFARVQSTCLFTSVTKQSDSDAEKALVERTCWMRETRRKAPHSSCRADSVTMQISPLRPWFLLCDRLHNFWDLFRISKFLSWPMPILFLCLPSSWVRGRK